MHLLPSSVDVSPSIKLHPEFPGENSPQIFPNPGCSFRAAPAAIHSGLCERDVAAQPSKFVQPPENPAATDVRAIGRRHQAEIPLASHHVVDEHSRCSLIPATPARLDPRPRYVISRLVLESSPFRVNLAPRSSSWGWSVAPGHSSSCDVPPIDSLDTNSVADSETSSRAPSVARDDSSVTVYYRRVNAARRAGRTANSR